MTGAPRFEWPAQAMAPHAERREQVPLDPTPLPAPEAAGNAPVPVADGFHDGYRWWVCRQPDVLHPIVTVQGWDGPRYVTEVREMEGANRRKVVAWIEQIIAGLAAEKAKKRAKGGR